MQHMVEHSSMEEVCTNVLRIALESKVLEVSLAFRHGIAYIVDWEKNVGYLSSPKYIHMVVIQQDLGIITSIEDEQRLE